MTTSATLEILAVSLGCALAVGALGLLVAWLIRRRSLRWQVLLVVTVAALGTYVGAVVIAQLMFLSAHDLTVMTLVSSVSAVVAIGVGAVVGKAVSGWSTALHTQVRALELGAVPVRDDRGPAELRALSAELADAQQRLESSRQRELRLEESRRELVSWVSHDLRTPLAGLRAMAEALEDGIATDPDRFHRQIRAEVDRMAAMVDDLFELSRIQAGVLKLNPTTLALSDLVSEAVAGAAAVATARSVRIGGEVDAGLEVSADPAGLSRVLSNLLMNAIRHTPADGVVEITGRRRGDAVEVSVSDGCGGLHTEDLQRVFDLGWQGDQARTRGDRSLGQGAGLGLAIVKGIVEAHSGRVRVENVESAGGCRFSVLLPNLG